jgi:Putative polyhydroxyalkanoic acid system protein (PHA_gran_rgn)
MCSVSGTLRRMTTPITINIPHQLGCTEARRRIEAGFAKITHVLPGSGGACSKRWDGDELSFAVVVMGQTIAGLIKVHEATVTMDIQLPGILGTIAGGLKDRLKKVGHLLLTKG